MPRREPYPDNWRGNFFLFMKKPHILWLSCILAACSPEAPFSPEIPEKGTSQIISIVPDNNQWVEVGFGYNDAQILNVFKVGKESFLLDWEDDVLRIYGQYESNQILSLTCSLEKGRIMQAKGWSASTGDVRTPLSYKMEYDSLGHLIRETKNLNGDITLKKYYYSNLVLSKIEIFEEGVLSETLNLSFSSGDSDLTGRDIWKLLGFSALFFPEPFSRLVQTYSSQRPGLDSITYFFSYQLSPTGNVTQSIIAGHPSGNTVCSYFYK